MEVSPRDHLETLGKVLGDVERHRRHHFLLNKTDEIDVDEVPHVLAARAISRGGENKAVRKVLEGFRSRVATAVGKENADALMDKLKTSAGEIAAGSTSA